MNPYDNAADIPQFDRPPAKNPYDNPRGGANPMEFSGQGAYDNPAEANLGFTNAAAAYDNPNLFQPDADAVRMNNCNSHEKFSPQGLHINFLSHKTFSNHQ